jgi:hypothetical protein
MERKMPLYPKLIAPLQIDLAIGVDGTCSVDGLTPRETSERTDPASVPAAGSGEDGRVALEAAGWPATHVAEPASSLLLDENLPKLGLAGLPITAGNTTTRNTTRRGGSRWPTAR